MLCLLLQVAGAPAAPEVYSDAVMGSALQALQLSTSYMPLPPAVPLAPLRPFFPRAPFVPMQPNPPVIPQTGWDEVKMAPQASTVNLKEGKLGDAAKDLPSTTDFRHAYIDRKVKSGFWNIMYPLIRTDVAGPAENPYYESKVGYFEMMDDFVRQYQKTKGVLQDILHEMTWMKTNPMGFEAMSAMYDAAHPTKWKQTSDNLKKMENNLGRVMFIRQLFGDPPYAHAPEFMWNGKNVLSGIDMEVIRHKTMGFL